MIPPFVGEIPIFLGEIPWFSHGFPTAWQAKLHGFPGGLGPSDFGLGTELLDGIDDEESTGN